MTAFDPMDRRLTPYAPAKKTYGDLPSSLRAAWSAIAPSIDGKLQYRPCSVMLKDRTIVACVYVLEAQCYIDIWGVWPEDDKGKRFVRVEDLASIAESPFRLPARFANEIYRAGESGMGYCIFTLVFADGSEQACISGNAVDFVNVPNGKTVADIAAVIPHKGREANHMKGPRYSWCLFGGW